MFETQATTDDTEYMIRDSGDGFLTCNVIRTSVSCPKIVDILSSMLLCGCHILQ